MISQATKVAITKQRALQIVNSDESFPRPVETDPRRWDRAEVEAWAEDHYLGKHPWRVKPS